MFLISLAYLATASRQLLLPPAPGPLDNPMKGFASYCQPEERLYCPAEMAFEEIGWAQLEPSEGAYAFDHWESTLWNVAPAKGKDVVIRVFLDYPNEPVAVPKWLVAQGVKMTKYDEFGGGFSPDYENPKLKKALFKLVKAMGARYDRDPRVAYVQVGLLGHWGEWHTYPHENLFASPKVQSEVISAMHSAFPDKPLMARNASYASCQVPWIGFHDDMIPSDTFGTEDWEFLPAIQKGGVGDNWKVAPTGGEMVPGAAKKYLGTDWPLLLRSVREAHFTWIGPYCPAMEPSLTEQDHSRVEQLIRTLGYEFQLKSASFPKSIVAGKSLEISIDGSNQGSAPFYLPWKVEMALLDETQAVRQVWILGDDVRKWLPGAFHINAKRLIDLAPGSFRLAIGIVNPIARKPQIRFANRLENVNGWTIIGNLDVVKPLTN